MKKLGSCVKTILFAAAAAGACMTALGTEHREMHGAARILAPERIRDLLPPSLGDLARGGISAERITALGVQIAQAEAQYRDDEGHYVTLRIEDMGGPSGVRSLVPWASADTGKHAPSDEKTFKSRGRTIHEKWGPQAGSNTAEYGEYAVLVGQRYLVEASGDVARIDVLKSAVASVDLAKLESLNGASARTK